jgi:hypothetical protein
MRSATKAVDHRTQPIDLVELRSRLLTAAGADEARLAALVDKALTRLEECLDATKETPLVWEGEIRGVHSTPDFATRVRSIRTLLDALGVSATRHNVPHPEPHASQQQINVVVNLGGEERTTITVEGEARDVTPPRGKETVNNS